MKKVLIWKFSLNLALSCCASMALVMTFRKVGMEVQGFSLAEVFQNLYLSLQGKTVLSTLLTVAFCYAANINESHTLPAPGLFKVLAFLLACLWLAAENFRIDNLLVHSTQSGGQVAKSCIYVVGMTFFLYQMFKACDRIFSENDRQEEGGILHKESYIYTDKEYYWITAGVLLCCWLPHLIIVYPANVMIDTWIQIINYNFPPMSSHHPIFSTFLFGFFTNLGSWLYSPDFGMFLFAFFQLSLYTLIIAYELLTMRRLAVPQCFRIATFFAVVLSTCYTNNITFLVKDCIYSLCVLLFVIELIYAFFMTEVFLTLKRHTILTVLAILGTVLLRHNGKYILYPTFGALVWILWRNRRALGKKRVIKSIYILFIPLLIAHGGTFWAMWQFNIREGSIREALSLPIQQTARYVRDFPQEITEEEKSAIAEVLDYSQITEKYDPLNSDPVRRTFKYKPTSLELWCYFKSWARMFIKHPGTYIAATLNQNYLLFYPLKREVEMQRLYFVERATELTLRLKRELHYRGRPMALANARKALIHFDEFLSTLPITGLLSHSATSVILLLFLLCSAIAKRMRVFLVVLIPLVFSFVVVICASTFTYHARYALPIVYSMPIVLAYYIYECRRK